MPGQNLTESGAGIRQTGFIVKYFPYSAIFFNETNMFQCFPVTFFVTFRCLDRISQNPAPGSAKPVSLLNIFHIFQYTILVHFRATTRGRPPSRAGEQFPCIPHSLYTWISPFLGSGQPSARQSRFIIKYFPYFSVTFFVTFRCLDRI